MQTIKEVLQGPLALPRSLEASLPKGVPQISAIMANIAASLPDAPKLPMTLPTAAPKMPQMPMVTEFIKSIEVGLPAGLPKLGQSIPGAREAVPPAPARAPQLVFE